jgi:integrase/recombinase XerD
MSFTFAATLEVHRTAFLESMRVRHYSPASLRSYRENLTTFFRFLVPHGIDDVREVRPEIVRAYADWLRREPYTTHTIHTKLIALRRFFGHLETTDTVLMNPCQGLRLPRLEARLPRNVLTPQEARAVLDAPNTQTKRGIRDKAILEVFYSTGIRREEMTRLTIHDVDPRQGFLRVNKGKGAKDRVVPLGTKASDYVREYLEEVRLPWSQDHRDERALWLAATAPHQPIGHQVLTILVRHYAKAAGIEKRVTPHVWRHTCATHLVAGGANIAYAQRLLGHRSISTTERYTRVAITEAQTTFKKKHPRAKSVQTAPAVTRITERR